ncbi:MAG: hypothetical protein RLZZ618_3663 [Pseudomonadota bacterium]|jgi:P-type conjugative transfer protein TrbJ
MIERRRVVAGAMVVVMVSASLPARAVVFIDPLNLVQNILSAWASVESMYDTYAQLQAQLQQLENMRRQLHSMTADQAIGLLGDITGSQELKDIEKAMSAHRDLMESLGTVKRQFEERLDTAKLLHLNWDDYVRWERERIGRKESSAMARMNAEVHAIKRIESDYAFARETSGKIAATAGTHEAMQLMNVHMNRVVQQNAELLRQFSSAFGRNAAEKEMQEAEDKARSQARDEAYRAVRNAALAADRAAVDAWKQRPR